MYTPFFLGLRFLKGRGRILSSTITVISIVGVILGVMVPIIVINVMTGFQKELKTKILGMTGHLNMVSPSSAGIKNPQNLIDIIKKDSRISSAYPYGEARGVLESHGVFHPVLIRAYPHFVFEEDKEFSKMLKIESGEKKIGNPYRVLIGNELALNNFLENKDQLKLILFKSKEFTMKNTSETKVLRVEINGIFKSGFQEYDNSLILTSLETLSKVFNNKNPTEGINIKLKNIWDSEMVKQDLIEKWGNHYLIFSWQELNETFFRALALEKMLMYLIISFILLVALFNVTSYQLIQVVERKKEIGILKTLGFSSYSIAGIFLSSGFILSSFGAITGAILGLTISANIETFLDILEGGINGVFFIINFFYFFFTQKTIPSFEIFPKTIYYVEKIPSDISFLRAFLFAGMAIFFSFLAGLWPSMKAAKMKTMEIMRYE